VTLVTAKSANSCSARARASEKEYLIFV